MVSLITKPCTTVEYPDQSELDAAYNSMKKMMNGITPTGNFWMMAKLNEDMDNHEKMKGPSKEEVIKSVLSIKRFRLNDKVQRSNDIIAGIDEMLRGPELNRNQQRDIQLIFHMTAGDLFMDQLQVANQKIRTAKAKANN